MFNSRSLYRRFGYDHAGGGLPTEALILIIGRLPDDDMVYLEELTHRLSAELRDTDVQDVEVVKSGNAPERAKVGGEIPQWGSLLVTTIPSLIPAIVTTVQSWLNRERDKSRSVTLEIDGDKLQVTGVSSEQQRELITTWLNRHSAKTIADA